MIYATRTLFKLHISHLLPHSPGCHRPHWRPSQSRELSAAGVTGGGSSLATAANWQGYKLLSKGSEEQSQMWVNVSSKIKGVHQALCLFLSFKERKALQPAFHFGGDSPKFPAPPGPQTHHRSNGPLHFPPPGTLLLCQVI